MATATVGYVQVQTVATGATGTQGAFTAVQAAVSAHNAQHNLQGGAQHVAVLHTAWPGNAKGMQWQLAALATLCRLHGCTMVRLGVHGGVVALCGTASAVQAAQAAMVPCHNAAVTACNGGYNPATHGNRVAYSNAWLCGVPAGWQAAAGITPTLAYGLGYLFTFAAPTNAAAYALGHAHGAANAPTKPAATKPAATKPAATKPAATA